MLYHQLTSDNKIARQTKLNILVPLNPIHVTPPCFYLPRPKRPKNSSSAVR